MHNSAQTLQKLLQSLIFKTKQLNKSHNLFRVCHRALKLAMTCICGVLGFIHFTVYNQLHFRDQTIAGMFAIKVNCELLSHAASYLFCWLHALRAAR